MTCPSAWTKYLLSGQKKFPLLKNYIFACKMDGKWVFSHGQIFFMAKMSLHKQLYTFLAFEKLFCLEKKNILSRQMDGALDIHWHHYFNIQGSLYLNFCPSKFGITVYQLFSKYLGRWSRGVSKLASYKIYCIGKIFDFLY